MSEMYMGDKNGAIGLIVDESTGESGSIVDESSPVSGLPVGENSGGSGSAVDEYSGVSELALDEKSGDSKSILDEVDENNGVSESAVDDTSGAIGSAVDENELAGSAVKGKDDEHYDPEQASLEAGQTPADKIPGNVILNNNTLGFHNGKTTIYLTFLPNYQYVNLIVAIIHK